jgi:formylmethanofuran dehydrogenase subunit E
MALLKSPGLFLLLIAHKITNYFFNKKEEKREIGDILPPIQKTKVKECPVCGKKFRNPSVLKTSGYVFCYACIAKQIQN